MQERVENDAELADFGARHVVAARLAPWRDQIFMPGDSAMDAQLWPPAGAGPITHSFSRVEERWEIHLRPDGSAMASVVVKRDQQISTDEHWRFVARRGLPGAAMRRLRRRLAAAFAAMIAIVAGGWLLLGSWSKHETADLVVAIPAAKAPVASTPPPPIVASPPLQMHMPAAPVDVARAQAPKTPVILPSATDSTEVSPSPSLPSSADSRPLDRRAVVQAAVSRAFASGETETWSEGDVSGFVVVGPVDMVDGGNCRNTVILARGGLNGDQTISHRRCQAADGSIRIRDGR